MNFAGILKIVDSSVNVLNGVATGYVIIKKYYDAKDVNTGSDATKVEKVYINQKLDEKTKKLLQEKTLSEIERNKLLNAFIIQTLADNHRPFLNFNTKEDNTMIILTAAVAVIGIFAMVIKKTKKQ